MALDWAAFLQRWTVTHVTRWQRHRRRVGEIDILALRSPQEGDLNQINGPVPFFSFRSILARIRHDHGASVRGITLIERYPNLPAKFNALGKLGQGDVFIVWEDDDIYLPHHISSHVNAMRERIADYSKPSSVLSTYPGHVVTEGAAGRFHASIAFTRSLFGRVGGWPATKRADFDQQHMQALALEALEIADPCHYAPPSYCFRYGSTQAYHGQHFMRSPDDEEWYDRVPRKSGNRDLILHPEFDFETQAVYANHSLRR